MDRGKIPIKNLSGKLKWDLFKGIKSKKMPKNHDWEELAVMGKML